MIAAFLALGLCAGFCLGAVFALGMARKHSLYEV